MIIECFMKNPSYKDNAAMYDWPFTFIPMEGIPFKGSRNAAIVMCSRILNSNKEYHECRFDHGRGAGRITIIIQRQQQK